MSARDAGHKAFSKLGSGTQLAISTAGPRDKPIWWRKSTRTVPLAGGMMQSGTITAIDSRVGPANPNTAKSAVPAKRLFADSGSNATSASKRVHTDSIPLCVFCERPCIPVHRWWKLLAPLFPATCILLSVCRWL